MPRRTRSTREPADDEAPDEFDQASAKQSALERKLLAELEELREQERVLKEQMVAAGATVLKEQMVAPGATD